MVELGRTGEDSGYIFEEEQDWLVDWTYVPM